MTKLNILGMAKIFIDMALGVAKAAIGFTKEKLEEAGYTFPYDKGIHSLNAVQKEILDMEANLEAARRFHHEGREREHARPSCLFNPIFPVSTT